jgi:hypothetical protein
MMTKGVFFATLALCFFGCCIFPVVYQEINPVYQEGTDYGAALARVFLPALLFAFPVSIGCSMLPMLAPLSAKRLLAFWLVALACVVLAIYKSLWTNIESAVHHNEIAIFFLYGLRFTVPPALCIAAAVLSLLSLEPEK